MDSVNESERIKKTVREELLSNGNLKEITDVHFGSLNPPGMELYLISQPGDLTDLKAKGKPLPPLNIGYRLPGPPQNHTGHLLAGHVPGFHPAILLDKTQWAELMGKGNSLDGIVKWDKPLSLERTAHTVSFSNLELPAFYDQLTMEWVQKLDTEPAVQDTKNTYHFTRRNQTWTCTDGPVKSGAYQITASKIGGKWENHMGSKALIADFLLRKKKGDGEEWVCKVEKNVSDPIDVDELFLPFNARGQILGLYEIRKPSITDVDVVPIYYNIFIDFSKSEIFAISENYSVMQRYFRLYIDSLERGESKNDIVKAINHLKPREVFDLKNSWSKYISSVGGGFSGIKGVFETKAFGVQSFEKIKSAMSGSYLEPFGNKLPVVENSKPHLTLSASKVVIERVGADGSIEGRILLDPETAVRNGGEDQMKPFSIFPEYPSQLRIVIGQPSEIVKNYDTIEINKKLEFPAWTMLNP